MAPPRFAGAAVAAALLLAPASSWAGQDAPAPPAPTPPASAPAATAPPALAPPGGGDPAAPASPSAVAPAEPGARPYVDGFCLHIATGSGQGPAFYRLIAAWGARAMNDAAGGAAAPVDEPVQGQGFRFEGAPADAPVAFLEPRRGVCALVYAGPALPAEALTELADDRLPAGPDNAQVRWRKATPAFVGRPRPPRWFLQVGAAGRDGVCADALTDLRRRDGAVVSMLRLSPCQLDAAEKVEPA